MKKVKVLLYCTKKAPYLVKDDFPLENEPIYFTHYKEAGSCGLPLNGKIVAECEVETEEIRLWGDEIENYFGNNEEISIEKDSCLNFEQIEQYLCSNDYKGYALHISNLKIFKEPKRCQDDFLYQRKIEPNFYNVEYFRKAPQNMMKVIDAYGDDEYILISVRPKWLCKILNGEKTIEVRKKVLKEMLE